MKIQISSLAVVSIALLMSGCSSPVLVNKPSHQMKPASQEDRQSPQDSECLKTAPSVLTKRSASSSFIERFPNNPAARSPEEVNTALRKMSLSILDFDPGHIGDLSIALAISQIGSVTQIELLESNLCEPSFESRLLNRIRAIKFPVATEPGFFTGTFHLRFTK